MATSGSTNFTMTRDEVIKLALQHVGAVAQGESPTTDQITDTATALNALVKFLQVDGMPLWAMKQYQVPLTAGSATYNIGVGYTVNTPKPLKVVQAFLHNTSSNIDTPMVILTRDEYNMLGNKTSTGSPIQIYYEPLNDYGVLHLFPVPDSVAASQATVTLVYQRPFEDFDASTDTPDFPQEWLLPLSYLLADVIAPSNGLGIQDRADIRSRAKELHERVLGFGTEEGSYEFQVDSRRW